MRLLRAYVFVSHQFSNTCGSSGAPNTMARLFYLTWLEARKKLKNGCLVCGRKSQSRYFQKAKSYEKEFKCCFGMVGRAIDAEDVIYEGGRR